MFYVVCYDVSDDKARDRLSTALLDFGTRIQESVFECPLEAGEGERMMERVSRIGTEETDKVRIYSLCRRCLGATRIYGPGAVTQDPEYFVV
jgi:CRISPR-associated protein Cas2